MNNFFDEGSPYLSHPLLTPERTATEVDLIVARLPEEPLRVVDIGCGFGRHAVELARRGCAVVGVDPSETMIAAARANASDAGVAIDFRVGGGDSIADVETFDLAICLFTTLGQQSPGWSGDRPMLDSIYRSCRPGATVVIEVPERHRALASLIEHETLGPPDAPTEVTRSFDADTGIVHEHFETADGSTFDLAYRLYSADELTGILDDAGFSDIDIAESALVPPPPTFMTIFARR